MRKNLSALFSELAILLVVVAVLPGCKINNNAPAPETMIPIPEEYNQMYSNLENALGQYDSYINSVDKGQKYAVIFGAELLPANCNRGPELLKPQAIKSVTLYLDRLKELGVQGVTIPIHYPLFTPDYPGYAGYLAFYKQVVQEIRNRSLKLDVESHVIFANTTFSPIQFNFSGLTFDQYKSGRKQVIQTVLNELQPDYLNIGAEPDTEAKLTGYRTELNDPQKYANYINYLLDGLDRGQTRIVAGVGTWGDPSWVASLAIRASLDGFSIHIYPVVGNTLTTTIRILDLAAQYHKLVILDEAWLNKTDVMAATDMAGNAEIFCRDNFSFWAPLDQQFLASVTGLARTRSIEYISPFWTGFFFAYLDYGKNNAGLSYKDTAGLQNQIETFNLIKDKFSPTGTYYQKLIQDNVN